MRASAPKTPHLACILALIALSACSASVRRDPLAGLDRAVNPVEATLLWDRDVEGVPSTLAASADGGVVFVASVPESSDDPEDPAAYLYRIGSSGGVEWKVELSAPIDALSASGDGTRVAALLKTGVLRVYNEAGAVVWETARLCTPHMLATAQDGLLCFYDRESPTPLTGAAAWIRVERFGAAGVPANSYPRTPNARPLTSWTVSPDGAHVLLGFESGVVTFLTPDLVPIWSRTVEGGVTETVLTSGQNPLAALVAITDLRSRTPGQKLIALDAQGRLSQPIRLRSHASQLALSPDGTAATLFGSSPEGQFLGFVEVTLGKAPPVLKLARETKVRKFPDFLSSMAGTPSGFLVGLETEEGRFIVNGTFSGVMRWAVPLDDDIQGYLLAARPAPTGDRLVMALQDGSVRTYEAPSEVKAPPPQM